MRKCQAESYDGTDAKLAQRKYAKIVNFIFGEEALKKCVF